MPGELDHDRLLAEIDDEVRRRRDSGEIPSNLEAELQRTFARHAPPSAGEGDLAATIDGIRTTSLIDLEATVESARPGVAEAKKAIRKAIAFQMRHVALQINNMGETTARALELLSERIDALEARDADLAALRPTAPPVDPSWIPVADVVSELAAVEGRVLHLGAGDGSFVRAAVAAGIDAYGVEADARLARGAEDVIRVAAPLTHCATVADEAVDAAVVSVEGASLADHLRLMREALRTTRFGGKVVVVTRRLDAWAEWVGPAAVDLAPGGPLAPETWAVVFDQLSVSQVTTTAIGEGAVHVVSGIRR